MLPLPLKAQRSAQKRKCEEPEVVALHTQGNSVGGEHNKAGGHTSSQGSWQHAQDLHKLMPDKSLSWKTEKEHEAEGYCFLIADRKGKISSFICTSGSTPRSGGPTQIWLHGLMCVHMWPPTHKVGGSCTDREVEDDLWRVGGVGWVWSKYVVENSQRINESFFKSVFRRRF